MPYFSRYHPYTRSIKSNNYTTLKHLQFTCTCLMIMCVSCGQIEGTGGEVTGKCSIDADCEAGFICVQEKCTPDSQSNHCISDNNCPSGYTCTDGICVPASEDQCTTDSDCSAGENCINGRCTQGFEEICVTDDDCTENAYCAQSPSGNICLCRDNYHMEGDLCKPDSRTVDCSNEKPLNSSWTPEYADGRLTQTWNGNEFYPPDDSCEWICNEGFHQFEEGGISLCVQCYDNSQCNPPLAFCDIDRNICVECNEHDDCPSTDICLSNVCNENPRTHNCTPLTNPGMEWNSVDSYQQEWNFDTERWEPEDSETEYNETPDDQSCRFKCSEEHRWNGEECEIRPECITGSHFGDGVTAMNLLNAMDLCDVYDENTEGSFGIIPGSPNIGRADWPADSGTVNHRQYGVMTQFGTDNSNLPLFGDNMAVLSSGRARDENDPNPTTSISYSYTNGNPPNDFIAPHANRLPETRSGCPRGQGANDSVNLHVRIKVPDFAEAFSFDFRFFSQEYEDYTCTQFNDFFIAMLDSSWVPEHGEEPIPADKNISFDSFGNYISVNSDQFFTVCRPKTCTASGLFYPCPGGTDPLDDTGYKQSNAGATEWLTTTAPVVPGEIITLRFIIWDTSDQLLDSLVLIDNFRWHAQAGGGPSTAPACLKPDALCTLDEQCCSENCVITEGEEFGRCQ